MRSIGKVNIRKLKKIVREEYSRRVLFPHMVTPAEIYKRSMDRIPETWLDICEMAHSEIERLVFDEISTLQHQN